MEVVEEDSTKVLLSQSTTIQTLLPCPTSPTQRSRNTARENRPCSTFPIDQDQVNPLLEPSLQVQLSLSTTVDLRTFVQDSTLIDPPPPNPQDPPTLPSQTEVPTPAPNPNLEATLTNATSTQTLISLKLMDPSNPCSSPRPLPSGSIELQC